MKKSSQGGQLKSTPVSNPELSAILLEVEYETKPGGEAGLLEGLKQMYESQLRNRQTGVMCYCFTQNLINDVYHFVEVYENEAVFMDHHEGVDQAVSMMLFDDKLVRKRYTSVCVGGPRPGSSDGLDAAMAFINAKRVDQRVGFVRNCHAFDAGQQGAISGSSSGKHPAVVRLRASTLQADKLVAECWAPLCDKAKTVPGFLTCLVIDNWWTKRSNGQVELLMICADFGDAVDLLCGMGRAKADLMHELCGNLPVAMEVLSGSRGILSEKVRGRLAEARIKVKGHYQLINDATEARSSIGYVIHPLLLEQLAGPNGDTVDATKESNGKINGTVSPPHAPVPPKQPVVSSSAGSSAHSVEKKDPDQIHPLFRGKRHPITQEMMSVEFIKNVPGRSAHLVKLSDRREAEKLKDQLDVHLLHVIRKLTNRGHMDTSIPVEFLFANLANFRSLARSRDLLGEQRRDRGEQSSHQSKMVDENGLDQVSRFCESLSAFGFPVPPKATSVRIDGLDELIGLLETEFADLVGQGREGRRDHSNSVPYMALQDVYEVGGLVMSNARGLANAPVVYRIIDVHYEPRRSVLGGTKYAFHLGLETLVPVGDHQFVRVAFDELFEEFPEARRVSELPFVPCEHSEIVDRCRARSSILAALQPSDEGVPPHRRYQSSSFMLAQPRGASAVSRANSAAANAISALSSDGRLVVDVARGVALGVPAAVPVDSCSIAIAAAVRAWAACQKVSNDAGESAAKKQERLRTSGVSVVPAGSVLGTEHAAEIWPAVVAFSLTAKSWGLALIEGLSLVEPSPVAWDELVLAPRYKRLLLATSQAATKYSDVIGAKSAGRLFLLHGPPGCGKTMTVEALSLLHGRPLYSVSFAELGSSASELESTLGTVLSLAAAWRALVLIDEGDALVERRVAGHRENSAMTSILLRLIERFEGVLFITTNRVGSFDPAALSRLTLAIRYEPLTVSGRKAVLQNSLRRAGAHVSDALVDRVCRDVAMSGRDVGAIIRLALALVDFDKQAKHITDSSFEEAFDSWRQFVFELTDDAHNYNLDNESNKIKEKGETISSSKRVKKKGKKKEEVN